MATLSFIQRVLQRLSVSRVTGLLLIFFASCAARADGHLPIVFVHGQSGSAQQFETQAMRFTSNGYPQDLLYAFEYDTSLPTNPTADLDAFISSEGCLNDARGPVRDPGHALHQQRLSAGAPVRL